MIGNALFVAAGIALAGLGSQAVAEKAPIYGPWRRSSTAPADYREMLAGHPQGR
jgi:hypothetical protein